MSKQFIVFILFIPFTLLFDIIGRALHFILAFILLMMLMSFIPEESLIPILAPLLFFLIALLIPLFIPGGKTIPSINTSDVLKVEQFLSKEQITTVRVISTIIALTGLYGLSHIVFSGLQYYITIFATFNGENPMQQINYSILFQNSLPQCLTAYTAGLLFRNIFFSFLRKPKNTYAQPYP